MTTKTKTAASKKAAKKVTKTAAPKKTAKKAASTKKATSGKKLIAAKGSECFWVHEGPILKDLVELEAALKTMSDKMFAHHVRTHGNDFADWVEMILKDTDTAAQLRKSKKPGSAHKVVVKQLKLYSVPKR